MSMALGAQRTTKRDFVENETGIPRPHWAVVDLYVLNHGPGFNSEKKNINHLDPKKICFFLRHHLHS